MVIGVTYPPLILHLPMCHDVGVEKTRLPKEIWVLAAAAFAVALGYGIVAPVLPQYARSFDVSYSAATALISVFAGMRLLFATPAGRLMEIFGERRMYMTGLAIVAASSAACGMASNYTQLLILRGLGGIGSVLFTISAMSLIITLAPPKARGRASSMYGAGFIVGNIVGPALGSALAFLGMRAPFFIYAGTLVVAMMVVLVALPETSGKPNFHKKRDLTGAMPFAEAAATPLYRAAIITMFGNAWTNMGVRISLIPLVTAVALGNPSWLAGASLTAGAIGSAITVIGGGGLSDRLGRFSVVVPGIISSGLLTIALGFIDNPYLFVGTCFLAGLGGGLINPGNQGALADVLDGRKGGTVVSTFQMAGDVAQIVGPLVAGFIIDHSGFGWAFTVSGIIMLLAALAWIPARDEGHQGETVSP